MKEPSTPAWHALTAEEAARRLESPGGGLTGEEAERRLGRYGPNLFERTPRASAWQVLARQFRSVVVLLLVAAGAVAVLTGDMLDALAIGAVLLLNVTIGFVTELRAHRAVEALLLLEVTRARALRDGHPRELDARSLVPGDRILLEPGQAVPADARLLQAVELRTVEASLTGESVPSDKRADASLAPETPLPDRVTMVYKTTAVVAGRAEAVVVATGMATEVGRIGELTASVPVKVTPLERRLDALGRRLAGVAVAVGVVLALIGYVQGLPPGALLQTAIALAVAAVPEGLPVVGTIAMAVGVRRMARRRALVRHLPVVETLGSATVICSDKTGTLTTGEMTVTEVGLPDAQQAIPPADFTPTPGVLQALRIGALANRGALERDGDGWRAAGDPTETALLVAARKAGLDPAMLRREWPEVAEVPFSSERMYMATFHRHGETLVACVKGAPGRLAELCDRELTAGGSRPLDHAGRARLLDANRELARRGLRVLALATGEVARAEEPELKSLTWVGVVGMIDPPAPGVTDTIAAFREAGIRTVMLTGDQRLTAETVARELGLLDPTTGVLDATELERLDDAARRAAVGRTAVFSRVSPETKLRIVDALQARGDIVAMLGDGVNDAAALRKADIGVAMGRRGTDLAKEASDLVLADDRFPTVAVAVEQGRVIFDNIRKFVFYLFSCNLAEIVVVLGAGLVGQPSPLLPLQILWLNLLTDTFPALALAVEPGEADVLRQPPSDPRAAILSRAMVARILGYGALIAACTLAADAWGGSTLAFLTLALAQIFHLGNARSAEPLTTWHRAVSNRYALGAVALAVALQAAAMHYPPLTRVLGVTPPDARGWLVAVTLAMVPALLGQTAKLLRQRR